VLFPSLVTLVLAGGGAAVVAKVAQITMRRLGLEPDPVLEYFGLAETQEAQRRAVIRSA
jgi:hypothetical protein